MLRGLGRRPSNSLSSRKAGRTHAHRRSVIGVGVLGVSCLVGQNVRAELPRLKDLATRTYDNEVAKPFKAAMPRSVPDNVSLEDKMPIIGGLAAGIAATGTAVAALASKVSGPKVQTLSPERVVSFLEEDTTAQVLDIRPKDALREDGSPDLRKWRRSPISAPYTPSAPSGDKPQRGTVAVGWPERIARIGKVSQAGTIILFDEAGEASQMAAKELARVDPNRAVICCVAGGAEAWQAAELPWKEPLKLNFNVESLKGVDLSGVSKGTQKLLEGYKANPALVNGVVATAAVAGASLFLFTEVEAILQVVGVVFALQFLARRLIFAEDREQTLGEVKSLLKDKIAAGQAGSDLKRLADTVLAVDSAEAMAERAAESVRAAASTASTASTAPSLNNGEVPANVADARTWIENWRAKSKAEGKVPASV